MFEDFLSNIEHSRSYLWKRLQKWSVQINVSHVFVYQLDQEKELPGKQTQHMHVAGYLEEQIFFTFLPFNPMTTLVLLTENDFIQSGYVGKLWV